MGWYAFAKKEMNKKKYSGVIVALWLPLDQAKKIALGSDALKGTEAKPETPESLHITLCYLGDSEALSDKKEAITEKLQFWADSAPYHTLTGKISGVGRFHTDSEEAPEALYASFDSPSLGELRYSLVELLEANGVTIDKTHGFTPHITLSYLKKSEATPHIDIPLEEITFNKITLAWASHQTHFKLTGGK